MNDAQSPENLVTGLILSGGRARRLGGVDKGLYTIRNRPLFEYVLQRLKPQVSAILISANRNQDVYKQYGYPVVEDDTRDFDGPLAGVLAGLNRCETPWLLTAPCDAPLLPVNLAERLLSEAKRSNSDVACAHDGERLQPTFCLFKKDVLAPLSEYLISGQRKIDRFLRSRLFVEVDFSACAGEFLNLNSVDDMDRFDTIHLD